MTVLQCGQLQFSSMDETPRVQFDAIARTVLNQIYAGLVFCGFFSWAYVSASARYDCSIVLYFFQKSILQMRNLFEFIASTYYVASPWLEYLNAAYTPQAYVVFRCGGS